MTSKNLFACSLALLVAACGETEPPAAPLVDAPPALTNQATLTLTGTAALDATRVIVRGGAADVETATNTDGTFSIDVALDTDALNTLVVSAAIEEVEGPSATVTVTHDGTAPGAPTIDPVVSPTRRDTQRVRGTAEAGAAISITGGAEDVEGTADESGAFELAVMLTSSETEAVDNALSVVATDAAGNESAATAVTIVFDPTLAIEAPTLDDFPDYTSDATVTISGEAEAGADISAAGGATDGATTAAADGTFSMEIGLRPNQRNEIRVFAVIGGDASGPSTAVIVHDDIAPTTPEVDPQASPTGATMITLTGDAEPGASIEVSGGASAASGTVGDDRRFAVDLTLVAGASGAPAVNELSVIAVDRAGNESEPATLTIEQDPTLPIPVVVSPVASPTSDATVTLSGTTEADATVDITGASADVEATADGTGAWSAEITLLANQRNEIRVTRRDSGVDTIVVVVHDDIAPEPPELNAVASPTSRRMIDVTGSTEPRARITITGGDATVTATAGDDGRFTALVAIPADDETTLTVTATDRADNVSNPSTLTITHSATVPDAPVVNDTNPAPTNEATITVTGYITAAGAGITISITGGATEATGETDPTTGEFSVDVTLNANVLNELSVTSLDGDIESPPTIVTVTHDDIAPVLPDADLIDATAGACLILRGSATVNGGVMAVEGSSSVTIVNETAGAGTSTPTAEENGSFSTSVASTCPGDQLSIVATDAAGNASAEQLITVTAR